MAGKKTYITALVAVIYAGWQYYTGAMPLDAAVQMVQVALTGAFLRHAVG